MNIIGTRVLLVISTVLSELKNFSKPQIIKCTLKVVISRKQETLLLQPINRSGCVRSSDMPRFDRTQVGRPRVTSISLTAKFFMCDFSYSCAAVDKISTETACRAVPLR